MLKTSFAVYVPSIVIVPVLLTALLVSALPFIVITPELLSISSNLQAPLLLITVPLLVKLCVDAIIESAEIIVAELLTTPPKVIPPIVVINCAVWLLVNAICFVVILFAVM